MNQLIIILLGFILLILSLLGYYVNDFVNQQKNTNIALQNTITNYENNSSHAINIVAGSGPSLTNWVIKGDSFGNLCFGNPNLFACLERITGNLIPQVSSPTPVPSTTSSSPTPVPSTTLSPLTTSS